MKKVEDLFTTAGSGDGTPSFPSVNSPFALFVLNPDGEVLHYSAGVSGIFGETGEEPVGVKLSGIKGNAWIAGILGRLEPGKSIYATGSLVAGKEKKPVPVNCLFYKFREVAGGEYVLMVVQNEGKTAGQSEYLNEAEKLQLIADNTSDAISLHTIEGKIIYMSPSVFRLHGYTAEELEALGELHAVHPDDLHIIAGVLSQLSEIREYLKVQYRFIHKNGSVIWVESANHLIRNSAGLPSMISVITRDITLAKLLEENLRKSEERYRTLVKNFPTGVLLMNIKGEILEVNQALLDILGSPGEAPTRMINLFEFENLVVSGISQDLQKCIQEIKVISNQTEYISKWGKRSHLQYTAVPIVDMNGEVYQVICNVRDITRMKMAEERSLQQIEFLNVVINTLQEPFFVKDDNHKWYMLNDAAVEMMGRPREELIGKSDYDLYPAEQADIFWEKDNWVLENGANINEEKITWSDGSQRTIITHKTLYSEPHTGKKYIVGAIHDITEIRETEQRMLESERKYHELFDNANDFIFTTDLNGTFTNANKAMLDKIGINLAEISDYNIYSFCKPEILENARKVTEELMSTGNAPPFEIETIEKEGRSYILEVQARVIFENGMPVGIQGIARDVSEKKQDSIRLEQMNRELQETNASKDKFYSIIAHDLKNPFNSLIGFADLLMEDFDTLGKDEIRQYVGIIRNTAKNSLILLENLLAWSRLQTGRMMYNPVKLLLSKEVDSAITVLFSLSFRKHIDVENLVEKGLIVKADQNMLISILHNLLMNAIKFTPAGGKITIFSAIQDSGDTYQDEFVLISVRDTGIGISKEDQEKLFSLTKPFTRQGTDRESGTGLGLLLTKEMVEKHGGTLYIESEPEKGSVFSFQIPLFVP